MENNRVLGTIDGIEYTLNDQEKINHLISLGVLEITDEYKRILGKTCDGCDGCGECDDYDEYYGDIDIEEIGEASEFFLPERIWRFERATVVFWKDGDKTTVRKASDEEDNEYLAFCAALAKKIFGSNNAVKKIAASVEVKK